MATKICLGIILLISLCVTSYVDSHPSIQHENLTIEAKVTENIHIEHINETHNRHRKRIFFIPFAKPFRDAVGDSSCIPADGDDDNFPDFLTEEKILHGGIVLVILIGVYGFSLLAVVCNDYFLPCVETMCEKLNLTPDVAAATFMSIATSTPEFFTNIIGTFVTESDLGIGTIVGSSMFNGLGVPAIGGLAAPFALQLDWYPVTRDCIIYLIAVCVLILITWDGLIYWFETLISLGIYIAYFVIMFNNKRIEKFVKNLVTKKKIDVAPENNNPVGNGDNKKLSDISNTSEMPRGSLMSAYGTYLEEAHKPSYEVEHSKVLEAIQEEDKKEARKSLFRLPQGNFFRKFLFYYTWPIKLILRWTVPNPKVTPNLYFITFGMCIIWIGVNSYVVSWMINIIGSITKLPDALLGMTIMAVGGCLPETVSMTIIARRGEGAFGVSNSLGANTMNVLYSLGLPWLLKNIINSVTSKKPIVIQSGSLEYTIMSLIVAVSALFLILLISKFRLSKLSGSLLGCLYIILVVIAILTQTVFFKTITC